MPKRCYLDLSQHQRQELLHVRDHHEKPYMREKAAALLKVADGRSPHAVAQRGLLKRRVRGFLDQFARGSHELLRYVGLLPNQ